MYQVFLVNINECIERDTLGYGGRGVSINRKQGGRQPPPPQRKRAYPGDGHISPGPKLKKQHFMQSGQSPEDSSGHSTAGTFNFVN